MKKKKQYMIETTSIIFKEAKDERIEKRVGNVYGACNDGIRIHC